MNASAFSIWRMLAKLLLQILLISILRCGVVIANEVQARTPPRGWNSYDSFSWIISEKEFKKNARILSEKLLVHGYEYAVVDFLWYRKLEKGASVTSPGHDVIDKWGRPVPDPARWPSTAGGKGFKPIADYVHSLGLKFGLHVMRGISQQALQANTPILGSNGQPYTKKGRIWRARDVALSQDRCKWMPSCFMSVNTHLDAGRAFLRSLYSQYADWGVDFIKHDCVFGDDLNIGEITTVSEILKVLRGPIVYSISPGTHATPAMAKSISSLVNMYRVTADDWDSWSDVYSHFNVARDFASSGLIGAKGLHGKSWPDLDMLPLGWLTDAGVNQGPYRSCALTIDEQKSQMTLWAMAKSPVMFGGDLRHLDNATMDIITNPTLLTVNSLSVNNSEFSGFKYTVKGRTQSKEYQSSFISGSEQVLMVESCEKEGIRNWTTRGSREDKNEVCWVGGLVNRYKPPICLHWRDQMNASLNWSSIRTIRQARGKARALASVGEELCLDSSPNKQSFFYTLKSSHFSPCNNHESQDWRLMPDGSLFNHDSGLCAHISETPVVKNADEARGWIAVGSKGEIYVAFFNLGINVLTISAELKDILKSFSFRQMIVETEMTAMEVTCSGFDAWSNQDLGLIKNRIVTNIQSHSCTLLVLKCS
eukprot:TRINITY_DN15676_c0_g1_i2.p1 TRINITY_DN15676_c0_g1~~TRINITY_DN15676_c0_g1_i2.p1  ORF type:complete len:650 (-),score=72.73 TRINITY_DN15676_c0_g1_i2:333-2282(-)